jgi:hypothetical protein
MKKLFFAFLLTAGMVSVYAQDKKREVIEGNGVLETRNVPVQSFSALKSSGIFELKMSQGGSESVKLEGDQNLLQYISVRNEGSKLIIDMDKLNDKNINFKTKNKLKVYVTFKNINSMDLSMIGNVNNTGGMSFTDLDIQNKSVGDLDLNLTANKINMKNKGVGNVKLTGKAQDANIENKGVGSMEAGSFAVRTMILENSGVGSVEVNAEKDIKVKSSGIGSVKNKGAAPMPKKNRSIEI